MSKMVITLNVDSIKEAQELLAVGHGCGCSSVSTTPQVDVMIQASEPPLESAPEAAKEVNEPPAVDSRGCPWDERVHSSNHKMYGSGAKKGQWIRRKNLQDGYFEGIEAELMGGKQGTVGQITSENAGGFVDSIPSPGVKNLFDGGTLTEEGVFTLQAASQEGIEEYREYLLKHARAYFKVDIVDIEYRFLEPVQEETPDDGEGMTFVQFAKWVKDDGIDKDLVNEICEMFGIDGGLPSLFEHADFLPAIKAKVLERMDA